MNLLNQLRLIQPEEVKNIKHIKCEVCGKFVSLDGIVKGKTHLEFTPDTDFTIESFEYYHKECWDKIKQ